MAFSNLYSAVCRGKWFVSFREVESNLLVVDKLLERDFDSQDTGRLSEREAIPLMIATKMGVAQDSAIASAMLRKVVRLSFRFMVLC